MDNEQAKTLTEREIHDLFVQSEKCIDLYIDRVVIDKFKAQEKWREMKKSYALTDPHALSVMNLFVVQPAIANDVILSDPVDSLRNISYEYAAGNGEKDLKTLATGWRTAAIAKVGEERYLAICEELGCDLAEAYVNHRVQTGIIDYAAAKNPLTSTSYIASQAASSSIALKLITPTKSDYDGLGALYEKKRLENYDPGFFETAAGKVLGATGDFLVTLPLGGSASWVRLGKFVAVDMGIDFISDSLDTDQVEDNNVSQLASLAIFNSKENEFKKIREESLLAGGVSDFIRECNSRLHSKILSSDMANSRGLDSFFKGDNTTLGLTMPDLPEIPDYAGQLREMGRLRWGPSFGTSTDSDLADSDEQEAAEGDARGEKKTVAAQQQQSVSGWGNLLNGLGLNGFSDVGKNLGYVFAMLPDLLIGMFTGQTKRLNISDNLMPIAAIFGGMFVKNPILKMLLIGLGGANLLNKAGHEALDHAGIKSDQPRQYKTYQDEVLDRRIKNPAMQGNTLIADIDGKPLVIPVSDMAVDAYYKGVLPLNTLSNAVLRAWDRRQETLAQNYEQGVEEEQQLTRSRGIQ